MELIKYKTTGDRLNGLKKNKQTKNVYMYTNVRHKIAHFPYGLEFNLQ